MLPSSSFLRSFGGWCAVGREMEVTRCLSWPAIALRLRVWLNRFLLRAGDVAEADSGDIGGEYGDSGGVSSHRRLSEVWRIWCRRGTGATISEQSELHDVSNASSSKRGYEGSEKMRRTHRSVHCSTTDGV